MAKQTHELWAEAIRDIGILLFVFAPLDTLFLGQRGTNEDWLKAVGVAIFGLLLIAVGVRMESDK